MKFLISIFFSLLLLMNFSFAAIPQGIPTFPTAFKQFQASITTVKCMTYDTACQLNYCLTQACPPICADHGGINTTATKATLNGDKLTCDCYCKAP